MFTINRGQPDEPDNAWNSICSLQVKAMELEETIKRVIEFTDKAHGEQQRKYVPDRYIVHPVRVMEICKRVTEDKRILSAAIMHDVLEDTQVTEEEILEFLRTIMSQQDAEKTLELVVELTDVYVKKDYPSWNRRKRKTMEIARLERTSPDSQTIKYADIIDNCKEITTHDKDFGKVFLFECRTLLKKMVKGNKELYIEAEKVIQDELKKLGQISPGTDLKTFKRINS